MSTVQGTFLLTVAPLALLVAACLVGVALVRWATR